MVILLLIKVLRAMEGLKDGKDGGREVHESKRNGGRRMHDGGRGGKGFPRGGEEGLQKRQRDK